MARGADLIPGQGTEIPSAMGYGQKLKIKILTRERDKGMTDMTEPQHNAVKTPVINTSEKFKMV